MEVLFDSGMTGRGIKTDNAFLPTNEGTSRKTTSDSSDCKIVKIKKYTILEQIN